MWRCFTSRIGIFAADAHVRAKVMNFHCYVSFSSNICHSNRNSRCRHFSMTFKAAFDRQRFSRWVRARQLSALCPYEWGRAASANMFLRTRKATNSWLIKRWHRRPTCPGQCCSASSRISGFISSAGCVIHARTNLHGKEMKRSATRTRGRLQELGGVSTGLASVNTTSYR